MKRAAVLRSATEASGIGQYAVVLAAAPSVEVEVRPVGVKGFVLLPRRCVVERTFGWLYRYRRLSKDYEYLNSVSETMIVVAMIHLMVRRLPPLP